MRYMDATAPPKFHGETVVRPNEVNADGHPAVILKSPRRWYVLREFDTTHGWGDRAYHTYTQAYRAMVGFV